MKIKIEITLDKDCVTAACNIFPEPVKGDQFSQCMSILVDKIERQFCHEIRSGKLSSKDPTIIRFMSGSDDEYDLETDLLNIEHNIFIEKVERLMRRYYPTLLDELAWWMLIPRYADCFGDIDLSAEEETELLAAKRREKDAYSDLEANGPNGVKWQELVEEHLTDSSDHKIKLLAKHGIVGTQ